jgi:hypothetical protein
MRNNSDRDSPVNMVCPVNWTHSLNIGLSAWWLVLPGLRGGKRLVDLVNPGSMGSHGILTSMDPQFDWVGDSPPGGFGSLDFDGLDDYVDVPTTPALSSGGFTVAFWCKKKVATNVCTFALKTVEGPYAFNVFMHSGAGYTPVTIGCQTDNPFLSNRPSVDYFSELVNWNHFVYGYNGQGLLTLANYFLVRNGKVETLQDATQVDYGTTSNLTAIGIYANGATRFPGFISDLRVYATRSLSLRDAEQLYASALLSYPGVLNRIPSIYLSAAAGGISPTAGTLTLTGNTAVVSFKRNRAVTAGTITLTGQTATRTFALTRAITSGTLTLTQTSPGVALKRNIALTPGTITLTQTSPSVTVVAPGSINPSTGTWTLTGNSVTVSFRLNRDVTAGALQLTGDTASISVTAPAPAPQAPAGGGGAGGVVGYEPRRRGKAKRIQPFGKQPKSGPTRVFDEVEIVAPIIASLDSRLDELEEEGMDLMSLPSAMRAEGRLDEIERQVEVLLRKRLVALLLMVGADDIF